MAPDNNKLTPMQKQYREIKARHRDKVLLFRLGDFFEMFEEDASLAASVLNIALTKRHNTPMCGFPHHAADNYIRRLVEAGHKVAVCDQVENPATATGIVKREIVNIITPGTILEENFLSETSNNFLCAMETDKKSLGLSFVDVSTGEFYALSVPREQALRVLQDELARYSPAEVIYSERSADERLKKELENYPGLCEAYPAWMFEAENSDSLFANIQIPETVRQNTALLRSVTAALRYLSETKLSALAHIRRIISVEPRSFMELDDFSLRNLELLKNMQDGSKKFTLLDVMDETVTPMGARLLKRRLVMPLRELTPLLFRQNCTALFFDKPILRREIRESLKKISDIDRLSTRAAMKKALPRELCALSASLREAAVLKSKLENIPYLKQIAEKIDLLSELTELIERALVKEPSTTFNGNVIRDGYHTELDRVRVLMREGKDWILRLQQQERKNTGISSLKIKYNKVFGYFIEVSKANLNAIPEHYMRKQSLVNAERFTIPALSEHEAQINNASEKVEKLEESLFEELLEKTGAKIAELQQNATAVAEIDLYACFAVIADRYHYIRPVLDESTVFEIVEGRHPVVEKHTGQSLFVPNDCRMDDDENRILIITGPNMAGKSTYLRQNALIALMAQTGSFVPAKRARIGLIDKIFTRIGASDELSAGRSTFLVEMEEAANILANATDKSLIIMDELGRGTSTYDGLSIAWAVIEYLHEHPKRGGKTLFATHYHELTALGEKNGIRNLNIAVREYKDELIFLRKVVEGPADRSYGIYVAKLAGMDDEIVKRASLILEKLEHEGRRANFEIEHGIREHDTPAVLSAEMELFPDDPATNIISKISNLDINRITPIEAITFLAELKKDVEK